MFPLRGIQKTDWQNLHLRYLYKVVATRNYCNRPTQGKKDLSAIQPDKHISYLIQFLSPERQTMELTHAHTAIV